MGLCRAHYVFASIPQHHADAGRWSLAAGRWLSATLPTILPTAWIAGAKPTADLGFP
jgi:hypothetical protein